MRTARFFFGVKEIDVVRLIGFAALACAACGSVTTPRSSTAREPETSSEPSESNATQHETQQHDPVPGHARRGSGSGTASSRQGEFHVEGEVGGLDTEAVERIVGKLDDDVDRCWQRATNDHEFVSGTLVMTIHVDNDGHAAGYAERTTLGNRALERCILDSFERPRWPRPVGGKTGVVRRKLTFDLAGGLRAPVTWPAGRVSDVVSANTAAITACKRGAAGRFVATAYLETVVVQPEAEAGADHGGLADAAPIEAGRAVSVGIAPPDATGEASVDCLVSVLERATYAAPGGSLVKVTFEL